MLPCVLRAEREARFDLAGIDVMAP